ncbi:hypothetical protein HYU17_02445 [Candidatus Woesearchaeota archaeon]|nr:hypothetical protein [Candidatus Woesearchaeota archaeon]
MLKKRNARLFLFTVLAAFSLLSALNASAADETYKPYLHKAEVPEHPKIKLYGAYSTELFPGAATYAYQIETPPGTNGLQPSLTVSYNSQNAKQRPGILGAGWTLTATYIYRDVNSTPDNTSDDLFKLVLNGAVHDLAYNQPDDFYHTKIETYARVQSLTTTTNTHGTYWLVTEKDGTKHRLGYNTDSEMTSSTGKGYAVKWSVDREEDTYGNTISYTYNENPFSGDHGTAYPDSINYNNEQARKIEFAYEQSPRPDLRAVYEQGNLLNETRRLASINISVNGKTVRKYGFAYKSLNPENTLTALAKITLFGADGISELHNAQFDYYNTTHGFANSTSLQIPEIFASYQTGDEGDRLADVNNDGFTDIIKSNQATGEKTVWINNKTSGWNNESSKWNFPLFIVDTERDDNGIRLADLNMDGLVDIIQSINDGGSTIKSAYLNNGTGWVSASAWNSPLIFITGGAGAGNANDEGVRFAELNGDGLIDMIQSKKLDANPPTKNVYLNNGSGWNKTGNWEPPAVFINLSYRDGGLRVLDLNADGLDDLMEAHNTSGTVTLNAWLNTGTGWTDASSIWKPPIVFTNAQIPDTGVRFADANGDGLQDMWQDSAINKTIWLNTGNGWLESPAWESPEQFIYNGKNIGRRLADANGDGLADILVSYQNQSETTKKAWIKNSTTHYLLKTIKTELGANITLSYQNSTHYNNTNASGISQLGFNVFVVSSMLQNNSLNDSHNTLANYTYSYSGGSYDYNDREFRGFSTTTETLPDMTAVKHYFHQDDILKGKEFKTETYDKSNNIFAAAENTYNYTQTSNSYNTFPTSSATYIHDGQTANPKITNTTYTYDQYGNVATITQLGDTSVAGDEKLERYDYVYNTTAWILDRQSWYRLYAGNTTTLRDIKYIYDNSYYGVSPSRGSVTSVQSWLDTGQNHQTSAVYGSKGELIEEIDALGRTTKYQYDTTKTFPEQTINPLGHPTRFSYDLSTGNLLWTEKNGVRTTYEYDTFSRIVKEVQPYDTTGYPTKEYTYSFDGTPPETIKTSQKTTANKTQDTFYYYDGFGQLIQIKTPAEDNQQVAKNFFYDGQGRIKAEQNPYFNTFSPSLSQPSATATYTNYTYDALSRVTNATFPDNTNITIVFDHWTVSTYDQNNHRKDYYLDAYDRITKITEHNIDPLLNDGIVYTHNTSYSYDEANQLLQINDTHNNQFKFTYDSLGRRTRLNDPDTGEWNYSYDLAGNLISQRGGGGNLVTGDGFYREYNNLNQLIRIRNGSNSSGTLVEEYTYDPYGERIKISRNDTAETVVYTPFRELMQIHNSSGIFNYSYIYDGTTLVARVNPDGTKQYYHPDHLGSTTLITDSSGNVVEETFYEPYGQVTSGGSNEVKLYTGQFSDEATNQYYYGARYYLQTLGKFGQADPLFIDLANYKKQQMNLLFNPQRLNQYSYALNNPYRYTDPKGLWTLQIGMSLTAGFGGGGTIGGGLIIGYSKAGGLQIGHYGTYGGGAHAGGSAALTFDFSTSPNDYIKDISGDTLTMGGSADVGLSVPGYTAIGVDVGLEENMPINEEKDDRTDKKADNKKKLSSSRTFSIGVGTGTIAEGHGYYAHTAIGQWAGGRRSDTGKTNANGGKSEGGWSNVIPDPSGRKDRRGNPIYLVPQSRGKITK